MSALSVQVPFPVFQDRDGQPLENGYVWIGTANLYPITNAVPVFFDAALTIPAAQPLRTINGYISNAGTPAQIYVDGVSFSILVQDSKGSMVYNFPDGTGISPDACGVTYDPPFTGGIPYPVCEKLAEYVSVADFGAVADATSPFTGTDNAAAFQAAFNTGKDVLIPASPAGFGYRVSTATISKQIRVFGEGMDCTRIWPTDGYSCFIVATDKVEVSDLTFIGKTGTGQAEVYGDCIKFDAVTNNPAFARHMEGCKIQRVEFRNLKMNGINVPHLLRESHIRECRFVGMGNAATARSGIYMQQTLGTPTNNNIIWIDKNMFYRFDTAAIRLRRSTLISPVNSEPSYDGIMITNNLIHGQLQDENGVEPVQPAPTNHVVIDDGTRSIIYGNIFTAIHPQFDGVNAVSAGTACKSTDVSNNQMSVKEVVGGVTYNRATGNATGAFVRLVGNEAMTITNNTVNGGVFNNDFLLNNGDYTSSISVNVCQNVTEAGIILTDYTGLGTFSGEIQTNNTRQITDEINAYGAITAATVVKANNGLSEFFSNSQNWSLWLKFNAATNGCLVGSPGANQFQVSTNGGTPLLIVDSTVATRPGADNTYKLGTASFLWSEVFAGNGTINTSDERSKQDIALLNEAEKRVALALKGLIKKFRFKDAVALKGESARTHIGVVAQEVKAAFESEGLDPFAYGILCYDEWEETQEPIVELQDFIDEKTGETSQRHVVVGTKTIPAGNRYGIRYDQMFAFIIGAM